MAEHPNPTILSAEELRFKLQEVAYREAMSRTKAGRAIEASHEALRSERDALAKDKTNLSRALALMTHCVQDIDDFIALIRNDDACGEQVRKILDGYKTKLDALEHQKEEGK